MNKKCLMRFTLSPLLVLAMFFTLSLNAAAEEAIDKTALMEKLLPVFGDKPDSINPTPVKGIYEAVFGTELIYVDSNGRYFFSGDLIDGQTRTNLTENARTDARKVELAKGAIKTVDFKASGEEKHVISVFTDVDCPFCVKLHREVPELNKMGVTVRYFAYPRAGVGSGTYKEMVQIWCSDDQQQAMTTSKEGGELTSSDNCSDNPVSEHFALGQRIGVSGTPALVTADGAIIPGYRPAMELVKLLDEMKTN